jgi:hypothetical protein
MNNEGIAMNRLLLLLLVFVLQGCMAGIYAMYPNDRTVSKPGMAMSPQDPRFTDHLYEYQMFRENGMTSCSQLLASWGQPDSIEVKGNETLLDYKYGFVWAGVAATVWLPTIPLGIPVGRKHVAVACKDDEIVSSTDTLPHVGGGMCGWWGVFRCGVVERPFYGPMNF